ncbi:adhesion G protein-coupled receptor B2-like isoform X1 [Tachypleus tridentatus]|uniref:adhesion G protein-coupled receptor B2-like isoform X1 n=1 Tax=Tachypleus tridentatus TaxID=6853 RepID=UPI003FD1CC03
MEELSIILKFQKIYSLLDRLDAICMISDIMKANVELVSNSYLDEEYIKVVLSSTDKLLTNQNSSISVNSDTQSQLKETFVHLVESLSEFSARIVKAYSSTSCRLTFISSTVELVATARKTEGDPSRTNSSYLEDEIFVPQDNSHLLKVCVIRVKQPGKLLNRADVLVKSDLVITSLSSEGSTRKGEIEHDIHFKVHDLEIPEGFKIACESISNGTSNWITGICWIKERKGTDVICSCSRNSVIAVVARKQPFTEHRAENQELGPSITISCVVSLLTALLVLYATPFYFRTEKPEVPIIIVNIVISVASIQVFILLGISATHNEVVCSSVSLLLHYIHLVGSLWLFCYVVHIYRQIRQLADRSSTILVYCIVSWLLPAGFVVLSYVINPKGYETKRYCWLTIQGGMGISFVIPMTVLLMLNTVFILVSMKRFFALRSVTPKSEIERTRSSLRTGMVILPWFFINWFFSVLAFEDVFTNFFRYVFSFSNSLQGLLIFLFFCGLNPKVRRTFKDMIRKKLRCRRLPSVKKIRNSLGTRHKNTIRRQRSMHTDSYPLMSGSSIEVHSIL